MQQEQADELEALKSIYDGEERFSVISENPTCVQYKVGDDGSVTSVMVQIQWPETYPTDAPAQISLDLFFNRHLIPSVKATIVEQLEAEALVNSGMAATFALIEHLKENVDRWTADQTQSAANDAHSATADGSEQPMTKETKTHLTKAQKRRMWDKGEGGDEKPRGHDWIDIVKHLSQTGGAAQQLPSAAS